MTSTISAWLGIMIVLLSNNIFDKLIGIICLLVGSVFWAEYKIKKSIY